MAGQGCEQSQRSIPHRKLMPECTNVTKHNCVLSNWETDEYGNQVLGPASHVTGHWL